MIGIWLASAADWTRLGVEAQHVIGLRLLRVAAGGTAAQAECTRMVNEKALALLEATMTFATGGSTRKVIRRYRSRVRANARRLSRRP
jgi:hypothetical protein